MDAAKTTKANQSTLAKLRTLPPRLSSAPQSRLRFLDTQGGAHAAHYQSSDHKGWRLAVLKRDHFACQECGARGQGVRLVADHVCEIVDGGAPLAVANGRTLCLPCHNKKTAAARAAR